MWNREPDTFLGCEASYEEAKTVLFGAPFDGTVSFRPGARFAPAVIRRESEGLETYSPYLDKDLSEIAVFDGGDLLLPFGDTKETLSVIERQTEEALSDGKLPFMVGGEHLVTLGAFRAVCRHFPEIHIVHFDAHTDLRDDYLGVKLSHATVIRRCFELTGDGRIHQFGIRSGEKEEFLWAKEHTDLHRFDLAELPDAIKSFKGKPVYLTVDLDVLDPSVFPGTGTPEPGGVSFTELVQALSLVTEACDVRALDCVELCPNFDPTGVSTAVAAKVIRELLLMTGKR